MLRCCSIGLLIAWTAVTSTLAADEERYDLTPHSMIDTAWSVRADYNVGGDLLLPTKEGKKKAPMSVVAKMAYDEVWLPPVPESSDAGQSPQQTVRYYEDAKATIKIAKGGVNASLPPDRRLIATSFGPQGSVLYACDGLLTRESLDLIDLPANSHVLDMILPGKEHAIGDTWQHEEHGIQALLGLDKITSCEVKGTFVGVDQGYAKLRLAGTVEGKIEDADTDLDVKAGYLFDLQRGRITRMNLAVREDRQEGRIGPAVDATSRLSVEIDPISKSKFLGDDILDRVRALDAEAHLPIVFRHSALGIELQHDRNWFVTSDERERVVFRLVDDTELIAQATLGVLPAKAEGRQPSLPEFQKDVQFALGKRLKSVISAREWSNEKELRCYQVVAQGTVQELPMQWHYYLAFPRAGKRVSLSVSVEPHLVEQLAETDKKIMDSLVLLAPDVSQKSAKIESAQRQKGSRNR